MFLLVALILLELFAVCFSLPSSAASTSYSGVLDDLKKDPEFNPDDYPVNEQDYSLEVISIAEGTNGELFIYVYQPCVSRNLQATCINMSLQDKKNRNLTYNLYSLTFLNGDGVFAKYLVNGFMVSDIGYRFYNIAAIYRAFNLDIDDSAKASDDVYGHMGYSVGRYFCVYTYNNATVYECDKIDVVDMEILAVGFVRYKEGYKGYADRTDAHFVAFSVINFDIDKIYDATVVYTYRDYTKSASLGGVREVYTDPITINKDICSIGQLGDSIGSTKGDGILGVKYEWARILTKDEFNQQLEDYKNEKVEFSKGDLGSAQYVFQFLETSYTVASYSGGTTIYNSTEISNVGVLRLHFLSGVNVYNLGVVSDLVSDDGELDFEITTEDNIENLLEDFWDKLLPLLGLIIALLFVVFFFGPVVKVVKIIFTVIKYLLSLLFWLISLPFKLISWLMKPK